MCAVDDLVASFRPKWSRLITTLTPKRDEANAVFEQLVAYYSGPTRHYHDFSHIMWMHNLLDEIGLTLDNEPAVRLAIWFHDVIYEVGSGIDNEQASADFAAEALARLGLPNQLVEAVGQLILDTKHQTCPTSWDGQILVDLDLSQLGNSAEQFAQDTNNIRREYQIVPDAQFWPGRRLILQQFLNRNAIYYTTPFHNRFEAPARQNLARSIAEIDRAYPFL